MAATESSSAQSEQISLKIGDKSKDKGATTQQSSQKRMSIPLSTAKTTVSPDIDQPKVVGKAATIQERAQFLSERMSSKNETKRHVAFSDMISDKIRKKYEHLEYIGSGKGQRQMKVWNDDYLRTLNYLDLDTWHQLDQKEKVDFYERALSSVTNVVSAQSVGAILYCAWGTTSCENKNHRMFKAMPKMKGASTSIDLLDNMVIASATHGVATTFPKETINDDQEKWRQWSRSASFVCMALLRLAVKEEENMKNAWEYLTGQYKNFYKENILVEIFPDMDCLKGIRNMLQARKLLRETLSLFLLEFHKLEGQDKGMCKLLYELQMCYTGMHSYSLFLTCADRLGAPIHIFLQLLKHPTLSPALEAIVEILTTYEFPRTTAKEAIAAKARTWRYARIFDQEAFSQVQTKNCTMLTSILAIISIKLGNSGAGDVMKIRQIAGFAANQREWLEKVADRVIECCHNAGTSDGENIKVGLGRGC